MSGVCISITMISCVLPIVRAVFNGKNKRTPDAVWFSERLSRIPMTMLVCSCARETYQRTQGLKKCFIPVNA